jgi:hypothetical protein
MTVPLFMQGAEDSPVLLPAEDARVELGALLTQSPTDVLRPISGLLPGPARGTVTASGIYLRVQPFAVVIASGGGGQGAYIAALRAEKLLTPTTLPGPSTYAAGIVCARVRDELYDGGSSNDLDVFLVMGANAATQGSVVAPAVPAGALLLQTVVYGSAGPVAVGTVVPPVTVAVGGIRPVQTTDTAPGAYHGAYRDHPTLGLQRWDTSRAPAQWRAAGGGYGRWHQTVPAPNAGAILRLGALPAGQMQQVGPDVPIEDIGLPYMLKLAFRFAGHSAQSQVQGGAAQYLPIRLLARLYKADGSFDWVSPTDGWQADNSSNGSQLSPSNTVNDFYASNATTGDTDTFPPYETSSGLLLPFGRGPYQGPTILRFYVQVGAAVGGMTATWDAAVRWDSPIAYQQFLA